jgi:hypothetical protein
MFFEIEVGWNGAESIYCIYKFTHHIFTESDIVFAIMVSLCIAENVQVGATLTHTLNKHIWDSIQR